MQKKTPGKLQPPLAAADFNRLQLAKWCRGTSGVYYRLHSTNSASGKPWPAIFFSQKGCSRFDPTGGPGTLYLGESLAGAMLEIFDDHWGPIGSPNRMVTRSEPDSWWVSLIALPETILFVTEGLALSQIGTDLQLLSGDHATAREWAFRLSAHPAAIGGITYASRHDHTRRNHAIFRRAHLFPEVHDGMLLPDAVKPWKRESRHGKGLVYGPAIKLRKHRDLIWALSVLEVGVAP